MDKSQLKLALVQSHVHWHDVDRNLKMYSNKLASIDQETDLVVLPEMFNTGFSMEAEDQAETMNGKTLKWMSQMAERLHAVVTGSLIIKEGQNCFNRLIWMLPDGSLEFYDKRHLFRFADEHLHYTAGEKRKIVELNGWKFCLNVCYDLRFPVWTRNSDYYDVLLFAANWPEARRYPWRTLLKARAIENLSYVIGLNRVGYDGLGNYFSGDSAVIHPSEIPIVEENKKDCILYATISKNELLDWRKTFQFSRDRDEFELKM